MGLLEIFITAVALSMDAFAISIANGLAMGAKADRGAKIKAAVLMAAFFGLAQGIMPSIGYFLGAYIGGELLRGVSRIAAFLLLGAIGGKMIFETINEKDGGKPFEPGVKIIFAQAVATSIDALAAGVSFAAVGADVFIAAPLICAVTGAISFCGASCAGFLGKLIGKKAGIAGGAALILIAIKTLIT